MVENGASSSGFMQGTEVEQYWQVIVGMKSSKEMLIA